MDTAGLDNDGDGLYDGADPDCNRAGLARIVNVKFAPGTDDTLIWTASPDALQYQVLRGSLNDLKANSGSFANAVCADSGAATNRYQELLRSVGR